MWRNALMASIVTLLLAAVGAAGPYSDAGADPTNPCDPGVPGVMDGGVNPAFVGWATGYVDYLPSPDVDASWQTPQRALGPVTGDNLDIVSLGDLTAEQIASGVAPGRITLTFAAPITNGPGADFAVFENSSIWEGATFAELAYVEVSSNGQDFARFASVSLTAETVWQYGTIDATDVFNLAGKHANAFGESMGTPFDLASLAGDPLVAAGKLDLGAIGFVRLVDVPGTGDFHDSLGNPIHDPWWTRGSGGFDLEAVGVLHAVPEPGGVALLAALLLAAFAARRRGR
ncbi:MAG: PEP-CTERM sorting domain-containing protein [Pirellulales bacterium]|nr:PEP-CTERM sorting domain-containing protein [Pirellulales bacterium]